MRVLVGTSGWFYDWNPEHNLNWYVVNSGLNAVELNASFYRFPFPNQIKSWAEKGKSLRWAVKVSRLVTHIHRLNEDAFEPWQRFRELFQPLDSQIDFYLFQLHPQITPESIVTITNFVKKSELGKRFALECRNERWFLPEIKEWAEELGITLVSIDAPKFPRDIFNTSGVVYLRFHGRTGWYHHNYTTTELKEVAKRICAQTPKSVYIFFNNDQNMLKNARKMLEILAKPKTKK